MISSLAASGVLLDHFLATSIGEAASVEHRFLLSLRVWLVVISITPLLAFIGWLTYRRIGSKTSMPRLTPTHWLCATNLVGCICVFAIWHAYGDFRYGSTQILRQIGDEQQPIILRGVLDATVTLRPSLMPGRTDEDGTTMESQLTIKLQAVREGKQWTPSSGRLLVYVDGDQSTLLPGDLLEVYGRISRFTGPTNPGEPDLRTMYRRLGLHGRVQTKHPSAVTLVAEDKLHPTRGVAWIAGRARETLFRHTDQTTGPLAVALVAGQREFVDPDTRDALLATGTAHLLSVSGMHLAILVIGISGLTSLAGWQGTMKLVLIITFSGLYVAVTGGRPPVVRAAILISILLLANQVRRTHQPLNTLAIAALILIIANPENVFSVGVHLSFLAVIVLMLSGRVVTSGTISSEVEWKRRAAFEALLDETNSTARSVLRGVRSMIIQMAWLSGCVSAVSLPLIWSTFHLISWISVFTNVIVWFGLVVALPSGVLTVLLDWLHPWLAFVPGVVCHGALTCMWSVIDFSASAPYGHVWLPAPSNLSVVVFYTVLAVSLMDRTRRGAWIRAAWIPTWLILTVCLTLRASDVPQGSIEATFVDVGHGTAVLIRDDGGNAYLYDCGRLGNPMGTSRKIDSVLWSMNLTRLNHVFLSHADADHYNAFRAIAKRFRIDKLVVPRGMLGSQDPLMETVRSAIDRHS
ncbi:MAG: ComEC/Rec2 family competence protein, partial [Planctomycetota bacterium]